MKDLPDKNFNKYLSKKSPKAMDTMDSGVLGLDSLNVNITDQLLQGEKYEEDSAPISPPAQMFPPLKKEILSPNASSMQFVSSNFGTRSQSVTIANRRDDPAPIFKKKFRLKRTTLKQ